MKNLLSETMRALKEHDKSIKDVVWVGCEDFEIPIEDFVKLANTTYNDGYGSQEVAGDLIVCGDNFWLERGEYDGSEWWEYKEYPKRPKEIRKVGAVIGCSLTSLVALSEGE